MATISSPGIGSGLDINGLVGQLVQAEGAPVTSSLNRREAELQAELSAYGSLKGALSSFRSSVSFLSRQSAFEDITADSSDTDILTAEAGEGVVDGSYRIRVDQLAESHSLVTSGFTDTTDTVGTGTLTFKFGTGIYSSGPDTYAFTPDADKAAQTVTIDSSNNTLQGVSDAINDADIGVTASVIYDGSSYRLTISADDAGADNAIEISVVDTGDSDNANNAGLSQLAFNTTVTNLDETVAAQDAKFSINGLNVSSSTNTVSDAVEGVTLNLVKADDTKTVNVNISRNKGIVTNAVNNFVNGYNSLIETINDLAGFDADTEEAGLLLGDGVVRSITTQIRNTLNSSARELPGTLTSLASIGITTERDGSLKVDNSALKKAVENDPDAVAALFAEAGRVDSEQVKFISSKTSSAEGVFAVNISRAATQGDYAGADFGYDGTPLTVDSSNDDFSFTIDGIGTGTITLTHADYTGAQLAVELQTRINGVSALSDKDVSVKVAFDDSDPNNEHFVITSNRYGDASKVEVVSVEAAAFGLSGGTATTGVNVEGTIGGFAATGSGRVLTSLDGLKVELQDDLTGGHGSVTFSRGVASRLTSLINELLHPEAGIASRISGFESNISDIEGQRERLSERLISLEARLRAKFSALDLLVSQLNTTSTFLNQQLSSLPPLDLVGRNK
jgi:flagellar hook-associated protein 2